ncbi:Dabb family protein [Paenibacillus sp. FSL W8-0426]|uniref:Dabb family protein n=1 Tax=Paenibacillus sp. FSL W8-0426 TaxID=2921714 RepID=UPI0030DA5705
MQALTSRKKRKNIHGYTIGLRVIFENQNALRAYCPHPAHQAFVSVLDGAASFVSDYPIAEQEKGSAVE